MAIINSLEVIIADDGLQHYGLQRNVEWVVIDVMGTAECYLVGVTRNFVKVK